MQTRALTQLINDGNQTQYFALFELVILNNVSSAAENQAGWKQVISGHI